MLERALLKKERGIAEVASNQALIEWINKNEKKMQKESRIFGKWLVELLRGITCIQKLSSEHGISKENRILPHSVV